MGSSVAAAIGGSGNTNSGTVLEQIQGGFGGMFLQAAQQASQQQSMLGASGLGSGEAGTEYTLEDVQSAAHNPAQSNINNASLENNMTNTTVGATPSQVGDTQGAYQDNFSPQALHAGEGIYGSELERQKSLYARQHGLNPANQRYLRDTYRGNPNWKSAFGLKDPLINTF